MAGATAVAALGAAAFKLAKDADKFNEVKRSFRALAESQGKDSEKMIKNLRELTKGTISDMDLMQKANQALLLGLPVDKFGDMAKIARAASKATGESMDFMLNSIVTGLGRGSKLILDNLGIVVNTEKAYEKYAATLGKTAAQLTDNEKKQAFINEAMAIGLENANKMGDAGLSLNDRWERFTATAKNTAINIGQNLTPALAFFMDKAEKASTVVIDLMESFSGGGGIQFVTKSIAILMRAVETLGDVFGAVFGTVFGALTQALEGNFRRAFKSVEQGFGSIPKVIADGFRKGQKDAEEIDRQFAQNRQERREQENENIRTHFEDQREIIQEDMELKREMDQINNELKKEDEALFQEAMKDVKLKAQLDSINKEIAGEKNRVKKIELNKQKRMLIENAIDNERKKNMTAMQQFEEFMNSERVKGLQGTLNHISSLQQSKNKEMVIIGKAAAIASITISTADAAMAGYKWGTKFGGPGLGAAFAGLAIAAGAVQAAQVAGVQLAEGGIVRATPGGIQATIGEGGQDEAVIPLDDDRASERLGGVGGNTFNFNGPIMGDRDQAREFARMMDQELTSLRRDGEALSFDDDII